MYAMFTFKNQSRELLVQSLCVDNADETILNSNRLIKETVKHVPISGSSPICSAEYIQIL